MSVRYGHATGIGLTSCAVLAHDGGGTRVVALEPGGAEPLRISVRLDVPSGLSGLWRTERGLLVATDPTGKVWSADPDGLAAGRWTTQDLGMTLRGAHGRGDAVVVWGERPSDAAPVLATWDGTVWRAVPGPGFRIAAARVGADGVWAVGDDGLARWDGEGWAVLDGVGRLTALDAGAPGSGAPDGAEVLVASADGTVSEGGLAGFRVLGVGPAEPLAVARWRGGVWIGAAEGLWRLGAGAVKPGRAVTHLDARGELLATTPELVMATADGARFGGALRGLLGR